MPNDEREPLTGVRFRIEIDGLQSTGAVEVVFPEARLGAVKAKARSVQYGPLVLRRGFTRSGEWYQWWDRARVEPAKARKTVQVTLMDRLNDDVNRFTFLDAEPVAYVVSPLNALGSAPLIETLELSVGGFQAAFSR